MDFGRKFFVNFLTIFLLPMLRLNVLPNPIFLPTKAPLSLDAVENLFYNKMKYVVGDKVPRTETERL